jgi:hypothetical protein
MGQQANPMTEGQIVEFYKALERNTTMQILRFYSRMSFAVCFALIYLRLFALVL